MVLETLSLVLAGVTFLMVVTIVLGAYWVVIVRPETAGELAIKRRMTVQTAEASVRPGLLREVQRLSGIQTFNRILENAERIIAPLHRRLTQADLPVTVGTVLLASAVLFSALTVITARQSNNIFIGLAAGLLAGWLPIAVINFAWRRRMRKFEEQFPEAIDLIARALRAGHAFSTGLRLAGEELPDPVAAEFRLLHDRHNFGLSLPDAMREFAERLPIVDARFFVTAVLTQRETGGNLAEVLDHLAAVIRERFRIKREVRVKSAHGRASGFVIGCMPPALALIMWYTRPEQITKLLADPLGVRMVVMAICMQVVGVLMIRKMVDIEY